MTEILKPCPFCGGNVVISRLGRSIECRCGERHPRGRCIGQWNSRPIEDKLHAKIAKRDDLLQQVWDCNDSVSMDIIKRQIAKLGETG